VKIVVATRNRGKLRELEALLGPGGWEPMPLDAFGEMPEVDEDQQTFRGNAEKKARAAMMRTDLIALADDSGLEVDALGGAPGVRSARFAGAAHDDAANNAKLLHEMSDVPDDLRNARFRCALCWLEPSGRRLFVEGSVEGRIGKSLRGDNGFGYDPLFLVEDAGYDGTRTMAELTLAEKNRISHRARALAKLVEALRTK
jgi:XTP/dITP diphosphohydrolase